MLITVLRFNFMITWEQFKPSNPTLASRRDDVGLHESQRIPPRVDSVSRIVLISSCCIHWIVSGPDNISLYCSHNFAKPSKHQTEHLTLHCIALHWEFPIKIFTEQMFAHLLLIPARILWRWPQPLSSVSDHSQAQKTFHVQLQQARMLPRSATTR